VSSPISLLHHFPSCPFLSFFYPVVFLCSCCTERSFPFPSTELEIKQTYLGSRSLPRHHCLLPVPFRSSTVKSKSGSYTFFFLNHQEKIPPLFSDCPLPTTSVLISPIRPPRTFHEHQENQSWNQRPHHRPRSHPPRSLSGATLCPAYRCPPSS
jgi:hypothetical protein